MVILINLITQEKIPGSLKKWKVSGNTAHNPFGPKTLKKCGTNKNTNHGGFQQQSPQWLGDRYEHVDSQNDC